jgi:hypothetical protein
LCTVVSSGARRLLFKPILGKLRALPRLENIDKFYGHLECFMDFGIFYEHTVHFCSFGAFFPVLVLRPKKNLATLGVSRCLMG